MTVLRPASDFRTMIFKLIKVPFWVVFENACNTCIWACSLAYVMCVTFLPWFSGRALVDDFPIAHMSVWDWSVKPSNVTSVNQVSGLGVLDIMGIVLPHIYTVLFPLILMVSALSAERAACRYHLGTAGKCHRQSGLKLSQWLLVFPTSEAYRGDASVGSSSKEMMSVPASKSGVVLKERCEPQAEGELET